MANLKFNPEQLKRISIITGHYGSGKTNVAINMAVRLREMFPQKRIVVVDLDIVNPYFRTADFRDMLDSLSIDSIVPTYANTNLDTPILPAEVNSIFTSTYDYVIIDVGGDDAGAIALGRYFNMLKDSDYDMYYVINECRYQTNDAQSAIELLKDIEHCSRLKATKLINNTNLGELTTLQIITDSFEFTQEISTLLDIPVAFCTIPKEIATNDSAYEPVEIYVKPFYE